MAAAPRIFARLRAAAPRHLRHCHWWRNYNTSHAFKPDFMRPFGAGDEPYVPVLVVGAGPVGLVLSFLLAKFGVKCAILEKSMAFSQHPQAHFINNRTMEIFSKIDGLAEDILKFQPSVDLWRKFIYCTSLTGPILGSVDHMQPQDFEKLISSVSVAHFSQYKLTRLLLRKLESLGFQLCANNKGTIHDKLLDKKILMGYECISVATSTEGVTVGASILREGKLENRNINCSILVGSDGARSVVRKLVGVDMVGERDLQRLVNVHFLSRDLGHYLLHQRPGMLFFVFNTDVIGVLVAHDLNEGEFVLQIPYYPPQQKFEDFNLKVCEKLIFKLVGRELSDVKVVDIKPWVMHAEVAEKFVTCHNRVILAGDAAHRFPPAGGFGMNTGIQDAHNLAWKITCLAAGVSSHSILETYELERKPIALANTALSVQNFKAAMSIPTALGLDPAIANSVHQVMNSRVASILPPGLQKVLLEGILSIGRAQVSEFILNENNPLGIMRLARLRSIFDEGRSLQLQFPAEDLGFRYVEGALVPDAGDETRDRVDVVESKRGPREYVPSSKPGSRFPYMQLRAVKSSLYKDCFSTLDLVSGDKLEFILTIGPTNSSYEIACAALKMAEEFTASVKICVIWPQGSSIEEISRSEIALDPYKNFIDVEEVGNSSSSWWDLCQMTNKGVLLVRPDEHIAWRAESDLIVDPLQEMERVFSLIFKANRAPT